MQLPINRRQFQHIQNDRIGLLVLPNKSMASVARCVVESSDQTKSSHYFSRNPWFEEPVNKDRIVPGLGKVRLVVSFDHAQLTGAYAV